MGGMLEHVASLGVHGLGYVILQHAQDGSADGVKGADEVSLRRPGMLQAAAQGRNVLGEIIDALL
jgi:hypothetical protein